MKKKKSIGLKAKIILLVPLGVILTGLLLFLPAGTLSYWQAWIFMSVLFIPFFFVVSYLLKHDPKLLERRMKVKEKEEREKKIIKMAQLLFFIGILMPGLDYRFGWSAVPIWLVFLSNALILLGYFIVFIVFKENSYTSRIVEVEKEQKVITTGPYAIVRHPMYFGIILIYLSISFALGSFFALFFFVPGIILIFFRIFDEERLLKKDLKGYKEYCKKVKYRLVPKIW